MQSDGPGGRDPRSVFCTKNTRGWFTILVKNFGENVRVALFPTQQEKQQGIIKNISSFLHSSRKFKGIEYKVMITFSYTVGIK